MLYAHRVYKIPMYHTSKEEPLIIWGQGKEARSRAITQPGLGCTVDTQLQSPRPLPALESCDYLLWPIYILTAGRQDVLKWRGRPSRDCSPKASFQFGWCPGMSMLEGCLGPDWQKQLWSLEAKGSSWVLLLPARPLCCRAPKTVQRALQGEITSG